MDLKCLHYGNILITIYHLVSIKRPNVTFTTCCTSQKFTFKILSTRADDKHFPGNMGGNLRNCWELCVLRRERGPYLLKM